MKKNNIDLDDVLFLLSEIFAAVHDIEELNGRVDRETLNFSIGCLKKGIINRVERLKNGRE